MSTFQAALNSKGKVEFYYHKNSQIKSGPAYFQVPQEYAIINQIEYKKFKLNFYEWSSTENRKNKNKNIADPTLGSSTDEPPVLSSNQDLNPNQTSNQTPSAALNQTSNPTSDQNSNPNLQSSRLEF